jgi:hypothetical protein
MDDLVKRTALQIKLRRTTGTIIHHIAILKRILEQKGHKTEMIRGFCVIPETKEACEHYWLRDPNTGLDIDIGFTVAKLKSPELAAIHPVLLMELPQGLTRSDQEEILIRDENQRLFELFRADPKAFWREAPRDVSNFR